MTDESNTYDYRITKHEGGHDVVFETDDREFALLVAGFDTDSGDGPTGSSDVPATSLIDDPYKCDTCGLPLDLTGDKGYPYECPDCGYVYPRQRFTEGEND